MQGVVTGTQPGRLGEGVVRRGDAARRATRSLHGEGRSRRTACSCWRRRTTPGSRRCTSRTRGPRTSRTTSTRWPRTASAPTSTTSTRTAARRRARSASSPTTTPSIWYTGDDVITREPGMAPGTASRLANDELLAVRAVPRTRAAGCSTRASTRDCEYAQGYEFNLETNAPCDPDTRRRTAASALSDDFLQYYLGAYIYNEDAGTTAKGTLYDVARASTTRSTGWAGRSARRARTTRTTAPRSSRRAGSCRRRSSRSSTAGRRRSTSRPGGPFDPHTGTYYVYSQIADVSVQAPDADDHRPGGRRQPLVLDLARHGARLGLRVRRGPHGRPERLDDAARRERAHEPEHRARTTRTWRAARPAGASSTRGSTTTRRSNADGSCTPTGTTGVWNAASGRSQGWEQWSIDLGAYAGKQVEVSIAYASDWSFQGLGAFVDDITLLDRRDDVVRDRPRRLDGDRAAGRAAPRTRTTGRGRPPTASPRAPSSRRRTRSTSGFGFEGISTPAARNAVMGSVDGLPPALTLDLRGRASARPALWKRASPLPWTAAPKGVASSRWPRSRTSSPRSPRSCRSPASRSVCSLTGGNTTRSTASRASRTRCRWTSARSSSAARRRRRSRRRRSSASSSRGSSTWTLLSAPTCPSSRSRTRRPQRRSRSCSC